MHPKLTCLAYVLRSYAQRADNATSHSNYANQGGGNPINPTPKRPAPELSVFYQIRQIFGNCTFFLALLHTHNLGAITISTAVTQCSKTVMTWSHKFKEVLIDMYSKPEVFIMLEKSQSGV